MRFPLIPGEPAWPGVGNIHGDPLLAKDYAWAWRRLLEQPGDYTYLLYYIKGAKAYSEAFAKAATPADWPELVWEKKHLVLEQLLALPFPDASFDAALSTFGGGTWSYQPPQSSYVHMNAELSQYGANSPEKAGTM